MGCRDPWPDVDEVHSHEIARVHAHGVVVEPAVEHGEQLVVLRGFCRIRAWNESLRIARAVDCILDYDDFTSRPERLISRIHDHRSVDAALDVQVGHRPAAQ